MITVKGLALIKEFEGLSLTAYPDPATGAEPWTIGYGHTKGVKPGDTCTEEQAIEWLKEDCEDAEHCIDDHVEVPLNQNQRDALISFIFNLGCGNFKSSTLLKLLNIVNYDAAGKQFLRWVRGAGKIMPGLVRRRKAEAALFMEET